MCFPVNFAQFFKNIFYYTTPLVAAFEEYIIKSRVALVLTKSIAVLISLEIFHQKKSKKGVHGTLSNTYDGAFFGYVL